MHYRQYDIIIIDVSTLMSGTGDHIKNKFHDNLSKILDEIGDLKEIILLENWNRRTEEKARTANE